MSCAWKKYLSIFFVLIIGFPAFSQTFRATVYGLVVDDHNAVIANADIGSRTASINFQVDGADNVDPWLGIVASNQGGIASVAGGLIPIEAIDQFSMQSGGEADQGRNAGANSNMVLKSGTNNIHGDVFYFDRNAFFAAISPAPPSRSRKPFIRDHQGGDGRDRCKE